MAITVSHVLLARTVMRLELNAHTAFFAGGFVGHVRISSAAAVRPTSGGRQSAERVHTRPLQRNGG